MESLLENFPPRTGWFRVDPIDAACFCNAINSLSVGAHFMGVVLLASSNMKNTLPIGKCCITGNFPNTSTLYILTIPLFIFPQYGTAEISYKVGLCSKKGPFFTYLSIKNLTAKVTWLIHAIAPKYRFLSF